MRGRTFKDHETGEQCFFIDGVPVPEAYFDALIAKKGFNNELPPPDPALRAEAMQYVDSIKFGKGEERIEAMRKAEGHVRPGRTWPMESITLGCHPDQVDEMTRYYAERGIQAEFRPNGRLVCNDQKDFNRKAEAVRFFHGDYGPSRHFSDPEFRSWRKR